MIFKGYSPLLRQRNPFDPACLFGNKPTLNLSNYYFCKICIHQEIFYLWRPVLKDQKDDMILELAVAGNCDYIVTYNSKHFKGLEQFKPEPITPKEFIGLQGDLL
ncbi:MAG: PIN domain-containing protein [wastewater metagenome]|nr:PIN domain-containing protein [Candidatus Loosdrechtia aerotolerans]